MLRRSFREVSPLCFLSFLGQQDAVHLKVRPSGASEPKLQLLAGSVRTQDPNTPNPALGSQSPFSRFRSRLSDTKWLFTQIRRGG